MQVSSADARGLIRYLGEWGVFRHTSFADEME